MINRSKEIRCLNSFKEFVKDTTYFIEYLANTSQHFLRNIRKGFYTEDLVDLYFCYLLLEETFSLFLAMVHELDQSVGRIVLALKKKHMLENCIIVFSTDNGGPAAGFNQNAASNWPLKGVGIWLINTNMNECNLFRFIISYFSVFYIVKNLFNRWSNYFCLNVPSVISNQTYFWPGITRTIKLHRNFSIFLEQHTNRKPSGTDRNEKLIKVIKF